MNKKQRLFEVMSKIDNSFKPKINEDSNEVRNNLINYLANIWSRDRYLIKQIHSIPELKNKYSKYLFFNIDDWNMLSDEELKQIYNDWTIDSEKYDSTSPNNIDEMGRPSASAINPKYTHFAVLKDSNKIVNGWDYNGHDQPELNQFKKDYFYNDIKDMDINPKLVNIYTKNKLMQIGLNPFDTNNWYKFEAEGWRDNNELNEKSSIPFYELVIDIDNNEGFLINDENKYNYLLKYGKIVETNDEPFNVFGRLWYKWLEIPHNIAEMI